MTLTVAQLMLFLERFPLDAQARAYEGEVEGIVIETFDHTQLGFIHNDGRTEIGE